MKVDLQRSLVINRAITQTQDFQISKGEFNGIILSMDRGFDPRDTLSIKLRHDGGFVTIASKVPLYVFAGMSNYFNGFDYYGHVNIAYMRNAIKQLSNDAAIDNATEAAVDASLGLMGGVMAEVMTSIAIDLGYLNLISSDLEFTLQTANEEVGSFEKLSVATYERGLEAVPIKKYDMSYDFEQRHRKVWEAFAFVKDDAAGGYQDTFFDSVNITFMDATFEVESSDHEFELNVPTMLAANALFGSLEITAPQYVARIGGSNSPLPIDLFMKVTGVDSSKVGLCYIKSHVIPEMLSTKTEKNVVEILKEVKKIEKEEPKEAEALRHAGIITKSEALEEAKDVIEAGKES